jgi:hypothetical protein
MGKHSDFGPSSFARRMLCAGSYNAEKDLPNSTSKFAEEGTDAHELAEICLRPPKRKKKAASFIGKTPLTNKERIIDEEMAFHVQKYIDYVIAIGGRQEYEQEVWYDRWVPDGFGTADLTADNEPVLDVADLKYGKGVKVFAKKNPQGMLYALGAVSERSAFQTFKTVRIHIVQPRLDHYDVWETTPEALYEFGEYAKGVAEDCLKSDAPCTPGEKQCQFCRANALCPELLNHAETSLMSQFDSMGPKEPPPQPSTLTVEQIKSVLDNKDLIDKWLKSVESYVLGQIETGDGFPGYKIVAGRSNRKWEDELVAEKTLRGYIGDQAYNKKLKSPTQAEKVLGKEKSKIKDLIIKPQGKPVLVPESDKREPIHLGITADDFDKMENNKQQTGEQK